MAVQLQMKQGELIALLDGEIDHHCARELREEIDSAASRTKPPCAYAGLFPRTVHGQLRCGIDYGPVPAGERMGRRGLCSQSSQTVGKACLAGRNP